MHCSQDNVIFLKHSTAGPGTRRHAISVSYRPLFRIAAACVHHSNASSSSIAERAVDQPFQSMQHDRSITLSRVLHKSSAISVSSRPGSSSVARLLTVAYYLVLSGFKHSVSLVNSIKKCSATIIASPSRVYSVIITRIVSMIKQCSATIIIASSLLFGFCNTVPVRFLPFWGSRNTAQI